MSMTNRLQHKMARITWDTIARTQSGRGHRVPDEVLDEVERLHDRGDHLGAARRLDTERVECDAKALVLLGLAESGGGHYPEALCALDRASDLVIVDLAKIQINRAVILTSLQRWDEALEASDQAQTLAPFLWAAFLQEMATRLSRQAAGDFERVVELSAHVVKQWPDWRSVDHGELARYLALDSDYALLRTINDGQVFQATFGLTPEALAKDHRPGGPFHKPIDFT